MYFDLFVVVVAVVDQKEEGVVVEQAFDFVKEVVVVALEEVVS